MLLHPARVEVVRHRNGVGRPAHDRGDRGQQRTLALPVGERGLVPHSVPTRHHMRLDNLIR